MIISIDEYNKDLEKLTTLKNEFEKHVTEMQEKHNCEISISVQCANTNASINIIDTNPPLVRVIGATLRIYVVASINEVIF